MKISIITPSFNSTGTIEKTIESVLNQSHKDLEYIIIDGASTDGTKEIIEKYKKIFPIIYISEKDQGIYDAMNKGLKLATGDIIGILNSDDVFKDEKTLSKIANCFQTEKEIDACYGDLEFFESSDLNKVVRFWRAGEYQEKKLNNGWIIPHPTFFARRVVYEKFGFFRPEFKLAGDYELLLRFLKINKIKTAYLPEVLTKMRVGGVSGHNFKQRQRGWQELKQAWEVNNLKLPRFFIIRRILFKIKQFFV